MTNDDCPMTKHNPLPTYTAFLLLLLSACTPPKENVPAAQPSLQVADNGRYLMTSTGQPFFWLGDTGWLLFSKLTREQANQYLDDRAQKGFNVIQVMVLHSVAAANVYGDSALVDKNVARPRLTDGNNPADTLQYDYWDHVDYILSLAEAKGLYMALVPVWGSNVKSGAVNSSQALAYADWLAARYGDRPNVIWLNGGDIRGDDGMAIWKTMGTILHDSTHQLVTFHPRGRTQSSTWFHQEPWLDFNMFQSGHRIYAQDTAASELRYGEDNWRYVVADYKLLPVKPTLDGEPSYEGIPYGLHDPAQPRWKDYEIRRYAYWSVFAGACGFTYGNNSVMQMKKPEDEHSAYGATVPWTQALQDPGAAQMLYLKKLMLARPYFDRVPDQSIIANQGERYDYLVATRTDAYAYVYTYNGRILQLNMAHIKGDSVNATWYSPRDGSTQPVGTVANQGLATFDPPGDSYDGNDWVLILEKKD